ncbi:Uncharacterised protein [uncultured archaeon]|nr:Uncharacterised protein [uncultured archaeon]
MADKKPVEDCYYNVHKQLVKRLQFLWNVDGYIKDAEREGHKDCVRMWKKVTENEKASVRLLQEAVKDENCGI